MKLWHLVLILVLMGGAAAAVYGELQHQERLAEAVQLADSADELADELAVTVAELAVHLGELQGLRAERRADSIQAELVVAELEGELVVAKKETRRLSAELRASIPVDQLPALDSLEASHVRELEAVSSKLEVVTGERDQERGLRVKTDARLLLATGALEDCMCTVEASQAATDAALAASSRSWLSSVGGFIVSPKGIITMGVVGVGTILLLDYLDGPNERVVYVGDDYVPQPGLVSVPIGW